LLAGLLSLLVLAALFTSLVRVILSLIWIVGHSNAPFLKT
jgi:hypothetical protein